MTGPVTPTVRRAADQMHGVAAIRAVNAARAVAHRTIAAALDVDEIAQTTYEHTISIYTGPGRPRPWADVSARVRNFYLSYARAIRDATLTPKDSPMDIQTHGHAVGDDHYSHTITVQTGHRTGLVTIEHYTDQAAKIHYTVPQALDLVLSIMEAVNSLAGSPKTPGDTVTPTERIHRASALHHRDPVTDECAHDGKGWPCPTIRELNAGDPT